LATPDGVWSINSQGATEGTVKTFATVLAILAFIFAFTTESSAKVLIYKGQLRTRSGPAGDLPKLSTAFLLIDPDQSQVSSVSLIRADGNKLLVVAPPSEVRFATCNVVDGKTASVISTANIAGSSNVTFQNSIIYFRGMNTSLRFSSDSFGNVATFPRLFLGTTLSASSFSGEGQFVEGRLLAAYQSVRTIAANDADQTLQQAVDALVADLKALGFETP
jgi:hypothetical protein